MREILLEEYSPKTEQLKRNEVAQLLSTSLVDLSPLPGEGEYELRAKNVVGTAVLPTIRLLIRPKVGLRNLFFLLGYGAGLTRWATDPFPYEEDRDFFKAVAWAFESELGRAMAGGLTRGYQGRQETLTTLRGRVDVAGQIRARQGLPFPLECSFEEYTEDTDLNRVVRASVHRLLQTPDLDDLLVRRLRHRRLAFEGVALVEYTPGALPELSFTRLDQHWEATAMLARLILDRRSLRDETGEVVGVSFTVDMNALYERFVERVVFDEARRRGFRLLRQQRRPFTDGVTMIPDLILQKGGLDLAVGDAKYKQRVDCRPEESDLYQMLAYCVALGLPTGMLFYAGDRFFDSYVVEGTEVRIEVGGIDMTGDPSGVLERTRRLVAKFIEEAERRYPEV